MNASDSRFDKLKSKITDNPILASLMVLGLIIISLSTFTDAAKNLFSLFVSETRPAINREWVAEITYPSNKIKYSEIFSFDGEDNDLYGTASYLEKEQALIEGIVESNHIDFKTKTMEYPPDWNNSQRKVATHQYLGRVLGNEIEFVMETYGGFSSNPPIRFIAKKEPNK